MSLSIAIRSLGVPDLPDVATVHIAAFPTSALTKFGHEAVRRNYESLMLGPHDVVAIGAFIGTEPIGFCFGGVFQGELSNFLRKNRMFLVWHVLTHPWLVTNPIFRKRLNLGMRVLRRPDRLSDELAHSFGIQSIAVHPRYQGLNVGKLMMQAIEELAYQRGFREMHLTVNRDNDQAVRFYERTGWKKSLKDGVWNGMMRKALAP